MSDLAMFEPEVMGGAMRAAEQLARSSLIPRALHGKPGDVLVVLLTGREFGLGPMQALRSIHVMDGKPVMAADLMVGLCIARREVCEYFTLAESTPKRATYKTRRVGGAEVSLSWTMEQATAAGLGGRDNWRKYPDAMLRARCSAALARAVYPDLLAGTYDPDELEAAAPTEPPTKSKREPRVVESQPVEHEQPALPASTLPVMDVQGELRAPVAESPRESRPAQVHTFAKPEAVAVLVAFGPHKGKAANGLTDAELGATLDLANAKLAEQPKAKWAPVMRANLEQLQAEVERRLATPPEPGAGG
ncbi:hypothetical protein [Corallococcus silvisoli]|uniref:hypothetical protein n=1 Tax=Corallococcus silvisoli TaxID=2697031 RepID=UPI0013773009|nr:hypothetical protein [Corallococcus silvisoli]NBD11859.1 hypothetical protein [Corallococcus silvisoli]